MFAVMQSTLIRGNIHYGVCVSRSLSIISVLFQPKKKNTGFAAMTDDPYLVKLRKYKRGEGELTKTTRIPLISEDRRLKEMENTPTLVINSLGTIFANEIPLERHAKAPLLSLDKLRQVVSETKKYFRTLYCIGRIRMKMRKWDSFRPSEFATLAQKHYNATITAIQDGNDSLLLKLSTETASLTLRRAFKSTNIKWRMLDTIERPRMIAAHLAQMDKDEMFAQVVVRMITRQLVAAYDQRGKLIDGDDKQPREVMDYIVFERQITKPSSVWRIAGKLPLQKPYKAKQSSNNLPVPVTSSSRVVQQ